ncbi:MAG: hypothetical protein ACYS8W_07275 [Planctomycetota bacterium]|jgi:hypothetical protein
MKLPVFFAVLLSLVVFHGCGETCNINVKKAGEGAVYSCNAYSLMADAYMPMAAVPEYSGSVGELVSGEFYLTNGWKYSFANDAWTRIPELPGNTLVSVGDNIYCLFAHSQNRSLFQNDLRTPDDYEYGQGYYLSEISVFNTVTETIVPLGATSLGDEEIFNFISSDGFVFHDNATGSLHFFTMTGSLMGRVHVYDIASGMWQAASCPYGNSVVLTSESAALINGKAYFWGYDRFVRYDPATGVWDDIATVPAALASAPKVMLRNDGAVLWAFGIEQFAPTSNPGNINGYKFTDVEGAFNAEHAFSLSSSLPFPGLYYLGVMSDTVYLVLPKVYFHDPEWGFTKTYADYDVFFRVDGTTGLYETWNLSPSPHATLYKKRFWEQKGAVIRGAIPVVYMDLLYFIGGYSAMGMSKQDC